MIFNQAYHQDSNLNQHRGQSISKRKTHAADYHF